MGSAPLRVLGLMSGTSADGIDVAIIETDGEAVFGFGPTLYQPYDEDDRALIRAAMQAARGLKDRLARPEVVARAEARITERHVTAANRLQQQAGPVDLIGFHGQTVHHAPERRLTIQIGDGQALANGTGVPVVYDMRIADVAAGGQGAPLVPIYHRAIAGRLGLELPVAIVNVGGVANVTFIGADGSLAACDTGPGNALLDDWIKRHSGADYDADGALGARGTIDAAVLGRLLEHPYFARPWPKSLDRDAFSLTPLAGLGVEDGAATLTAFSARTIAGGLAAFGAAPRRVVVVGGGARNGTLMRMLAAELHCAVDRMDRFGLEADFIEAQAFAYCAARHAGRLPITFPGTTGVPVPMPGGRRVEPER